MLVVAFATSVVGAVPAAGLTPAPPQMLYPGDGAAYPAASTITFGIKAHNGSPFNASCSSGSASIRLIIGKSSITDQEGRLVQGERVYEADFHTVSSESKEIDMWTLYSALCEDTPPASVWSTPGAYYWQAVGPWRSYDGEHPAPISSLTITSPGTVANCSDKQAVDAELKTLLDRRKRIRQRLRRIADRAARRRLKTRLASVKRHIQGKRKRLERLEPLCPE